MGFALSAEGDKILGKKTDKKMDGRGGGVQKTTDSAPVGLRDRTIMPGCATRRSLGPSPLSLLHTELP